MRKSTSACARSPPRIPCRIPFTWRCSLQGRRCTFPTQPPPLSAMGNGIEQITMIEPRADQPGWEAELFRLLVENSKDYAVFVIDREGRVLTWSPWAERVLGYS